MCKQHSDLLWESSFSASYLTLYPNDVTSTLASDKSQQNRTSHGVSVVGHGTEMRHYTSKLCHMAGDLTEALEDQEGKPPVCYSTSRPTIYLAKGNAICCRRGILKFSI